MTPAAATVFLASLPASVRAINPQLAAHAGEAPAPHRARWMTHVDPRLTRAGDTTTALLRGMVLVSEANRREHDAARGRRAAWQKRIVRGALSYMAPPRVTDGRRWTVTITRAAPRRLDSDNLVRAAKAVRDAIAAWLGVDDSPRSPVAWAYAEVNAPKAACLVRIDIAPCPAETR